MSIITLDDRDKAIVYSAGWAQGGSTNEFDKTTTWTAVAGSTAKVTFNGTSIAAYGTIPSKAKLASIAPVSTYSIDGGTAVVFTAAEADKLQYSQLFFQSPVLADGAHTLTITHPLITDPFFLDKFMVTQSAATASTASTSQTTTGTLLSTLSTSSTTSTTSTSTSSTTTSTSSTASTTSTSSSAAPVTVTVTSLNGTPTSDTDAAAASAASVKSAASSKSNTGAIVGGIIGAIVVLFLLTFGFIVWRRRRRIRRNSVISNNFWNTGPTAPAVPAKPFALATPPGTPRPSNNVPMMAQAPYAPRYQGGYAPTPAPNQAQAYGAYRPASEAPFSAYATDAYQDQGYQGNTYASPSQILANNTGGSYGRGAPVPTNNPNYAYEAQAAPRTRVRLD